MRNILNKAPKKTQNPFVIPFKTIFRMLDIELDRVDTNKLSINTLTRANLLERLNEEARRREKISEFFLTNLPHTSYPSGK